MRRRITAKRELLYAYLSLHRECSTTKMLSTHNLSILVVRGFRDSVVSLVRSIFGAAMFARRKHSTLEPQSFAGYYVISNNKPICDWSSTQQCISCSRDLLVEVRDPFSNLPIHSGWRCTLRQVLLRNNSIAQGRMLMLPKKSEDVCLLPQDDTLRPSYNKSDPNRQW